MCKSLCEEKNIDKKIETFYSKIDGEIIKTTYDSSGFMSSHQNDSKGTLDKSSFWIFVTTDKGEYTIYVDCITVNTIEDYEVGVSGMTLSEGYLYGTTELVELCEI